MFSLLVLTKELGPQSKIDAFLRGRQGLCSQVMLAAQPQGQGLGPGVPNELARHPQ